jgi:FtsP/CotA-like multicopper oxidase with cupredoxin domain
VNYSDTRARRTALTTARDSFHPRTSILFLSILTLLLSAASAQAQNRAGRGAMSTQDMQKMAAGPLTSSASTGACPDLAAGLTITAPADLYSQNGVLEVTLNLETDVDAAARQRYCYVTNTGLVAPNLRVNPGDTLLIHFYNQLPTGLVPVVPEVMPSMSGMASMSHDSASGTASGMQVTLHADAQAGTSTPSPCNGGAMSASASNLHFYGLNVSPICHSDEVVNTLVQPGQEFDYSVQIPSNEPSGLYWYHPHPHGFSEGQVQGGATGAIIVEGLQQANTSLAGLPEQTLVLRDLLVPVSEQNDTNVPAWDLSRDNVPVSFPAYTPAIMPVAPGQKQLWRLLNSAADTILNLQYVVGGTAQTFTVVAIDGVPITGGSIQESSVLLPPGSRAEVVVTTPAVGQTAQLVTQYVNTGPDGDYDPTRPIANIVASTSAPRCRFCRQ